MEAGKSAIPSRMLYVAESEKDFFRGSRLRNINF